MQSSESSFSNSWFNTLNFVGEWLYFFFLISGATTLLSVLNAPGIFISDAEIQEFSQSSISTFTNVFALIVGSWLTMFVWIVVYSWRRKEADTGKLWGEGELSQFLKDALWATPSYILYSFGYIILLFISFLALVFPALYLGPKLMFFPNMGALGLIPQEDGKMGFTHSLTAGEYFPCLFFFIFMFIMPMSYFAFLGQLKDVAPIFVVVAGFVAISVVSLFMDIWACLYIHDLLRSKGKSTL